MSALVFGNLVLKLEQITQLVEAVDEAGFIEGVNRKVNPPSIG